MNEGHTWQPREMSLVVKSPRKFSRENYAKVSLIKGESGLGKNGLPTVLIQKSNQMIFLPSTV